jgi:CheY-like chemotaxis protein
MEVAKLGKADWLLFELPAAGGTLMLGLALATYTPGNSTRKRRILIVDDNVDAGVLFGMLLREEGHDVQLAHDGPTALETAVSFLPEVVLLDLGMPRMDGHEVAARLRQQPAMKDTLLIAVSGYSREDKQRQCLEAGFDAYLAKPVTLEMLYEVLGRLEAATGS